MEDRETSNVQRQTNKVNNLDKVLVENCKIVVSSDNGVVDHIQNWFDSGNYLINRELKKLNISEF